MIYSILWEKSQKYDLEKCDLLLDLELTEDGVYMYNKNIFEKRRKLQISMYSSNIYHSASFCR